MSGQKASLGISIAGGKGSLPYKDHDEVGAGMGEKKNVCTKHCIYVFFHIFFFPFRAFLSPVLEKGGHQKKQGSTLETDYWRCVPLTSFIFIQPSFEKTAILLDKKEAVSSSCCSSCDQWRALHDQHGAIGLTRVWPTENQITICFWITRAK